MPSDDKPWLSPDPKAREAWIRQHVTLYRVTSEIHDAITELWLHLDAARLERDEARRALDHMEFRNHPFSPGCSGCAEAYRITHGGGMPEWVKAALAKGGG